MKVLVTGGAGYIGSHTSVELLNNNHEVVVVDNLSNSKEIAIKRVEQITGKKVAFFNADLLNQDDLNHIFEKEKVDAVIHFAGLKAVGESVKNPLLYYRNNLGSTLNLLSVMVEHHVKNLIFSSSATVYGIPKSVPIKEDFPLSATNPYGRTKLMIEEILKDLYNSNKNLSITLLRYFNPVGAHESGLLGEDPKGIPNNLMPFISQVAIGKLPKLQIFGDSWNTPDGTCIRDYIHVVDLARGHLAALNKLKTPGLYIYNLGTGNGVSVLEMVHAFEKANGITIPYEIAVKREGDVAQMYADTTKANTDLDWKAVKTIEEMCRDSWNFQTKNPNGY